jgi:putative transcriptional regulator
MTNTIKVQRAMHNMTQADLADKIGVSRQTINAMESNKYVPSTVLALKIAKLFSVPVEEIFKLEETD